MNGQCYPTDTPRTPRCWRSTQGVGRTVKRWAIHYLRFAMRSIIVLPRRGYNSGQNTKPRPWRPYHGHTSDL